MHLELRSTMIYFSHNFSQYIIAPSNNHSLVLRSEQLNSSLHLHHKSPCVSYNNQLKCLMLGKENYSLVLVVVFPTRIRNLLQLLRQTHIYEWTQVSLFHQLQTWGLSLQEEQFKKSSQFKSYSYLGEKELKTVKLLLDCL